MGCDIHLSIEYKPYKTTSGQTTSWYCWGEDIIRVRDYFMFGYLGGVQNPLEAIHPIVLPRGIPKDIGYQVKERIENYGTDGHTHTWLFTKEFIMACILRQINFGGQISKEWIVLRDTLKLLTKHYGERNIRLIIFFDN